MSFAAVSLKRLNVRLPWRSWSISPEEFEQSMAERLKGVVFAQVEDLTVLPPGENLPQATLRASFPRLKRLNGRLAPR